MRTNNSSSGSRAHAEESVGWGGWTRVVAELVSSSAGIISMATPLTINFQLKQTQNALPRASGRCQEGETGPFWSHDSTRLLHSGKNHTTKQHWTSKSCFYFTITSVRTPKPQLKLMHGKYYWLMGWYLNYVPCSFTRGVISPLCQF